MRIGVLGSGVVGKVLAAGFAGQGHEVMIGSRQPEKLADWLQENPGMGSGFFGDSAAFAELVVLAVKGTAANKALSLAGEENHAGKPVIDATNPIADQPPVKGVVTELLDQFGWETEDMGAVEAARAIEPLCMLYCIPCLTRDQWGHAFKLLK